MTFQFSRTVLPCGCGKLNWGFLSSGFLHFGVLSSVQFLVTIFHCKIMPTLALRDSDRNGSLYHFPIHCLPSTGFETWQYYARTLRVGLPVSFLQGLLAYLLEAFSASSPFQRAALLELGWIWLLFCVFPNFPSPPFKYFIITFVNFWSSFLPFLFRIVILTFLIYISRPYLIHFYLCTHKHTVCLWLLSILEDFELY